MALENAIRDPRTQIGGLVVLLDMSGVRFAHAKFLSPNLSKRSAEVIQDSFPMRFKAFHILHEPFYFDAVLALIKPFMSEKIRNRVSDSANLTQKSHFFIRDIIRVRLFNLIVLFFTLSSIDSYAWQRSQILTSTHSKGGPTSRIRWNARCIWQQQMERAAR